MTIAARFDVETALQRGLSGTEADYIDQLLERADGLIYGEIPDTHFSGTARGTATIRGQDSFEVWLPGRPVTDVVSVVVDGSTLAYGTDYDWSPRGDLDRTSGPKMWPRTADITVVWDYGLDDPPADVVSVAADIVAAAITNPTGIRQESIGQYSYTLAEAVAGMRINRDHARILRRYRFGIPV